MTMTAITLCSKALLKLGANTISSFDEGTAESEMAAILYGNVRDSVLSSYLWSFALAQERLAMFASEPIADFAFSYALPLDFLRVISAGSSGRGRGIEYRITGNSLHSNSAEVMLTYIYRPKEDDLPPFFIQALVTKLAAEFCLPLTDSISKTDYLNKLAEEEIRRARLIDSQQDTIQAIDSFPLIEVRS